MTTIQKRIKELRLEKGYTQEELARLLGLNSKSNIANYESGANAPSDKIKIKMCQLFDCSMDYLMGLTSYKDAKKEIENELAKLNLSKEEYEEIKLLILNHNLDFTDLLLNNNLSEKIKNAIEIIYKVAVDFDFEQMINKLDGKKTSYGSVSFPKDIDNDFLDKKLSEISQVTSSRIKAILQNLNESKFIKNNSKYYIVPIVGKIAAGKPILADEYIDGYLPIDPNLMNIANPEECFFLRVNGESMNKVIRNGSYALIRKQDMVENGEIAVVLVNGYDATLKKFTKNNDVVVLEPMSDDPSFQTQIYDKNTPIKIIGKYIGKFEMNS